MPRKTKGPKTPAVILCGHCRRRLETDKYGGMRPDSATPSDHIHGTPSTSGPTGWVMCSTCGHYTSYYPA